MARLVRRIVGNKDAQMRRRLSYLAFLVVACLALFSADRAEARTRVYLMRGLFDTSTGLDQLAAKLRRRGISATVASHTAVEDLTAAAIRNYRNGSGCPVVIVGHSLGADAAISMADSLKAAHIPVALIVTFSPASSLSVPGNVARVVNYYQSNSVWNNVYARNDGFRGAVRNVDLASDDRIDHFNIEKVARLQAEAMRLIQSVSGTCGSRNKPD
jgi:hypothetical protein